MHEVKRCKYCGTPLHYRRSDAKHCSSSCRSKTWRTQQQRKVSVKILLTLPQLDILKNEANSLGLFLNELIITKALQADAVSTSV